MMRRIVFVAVVVLLGVAAFAFLAPLAPDGSWWSDAGRTVADALRAFWGNPIAP